MAAAHFGDAATCDCNPTLIRASASPWTCPHGNTWRLGVPGDRYCWTREPSSATRGTDGPEHKHIWQESGHDAVRVCECGVMLAHGQVFYPTWEWISSPEGTLELEHPVGEAVWHPPPVDTPRAVDPLTGFFDIRGRGVVFATVEPDPPYRPGEIVVLAGLPCLVRGIERQGFQEPGRKIGLLLQPVGSEETSALRDRMIGT